MHSAFKWQWVKCWQFFSRQGKLIMLQPLFYLQACNHRLFLKPPPPLLLLHKVFHLPKVQPVRLQLFLVQVCPVFQFHFLFNQCGGLQSWLLFQQKRSLWKYVVKLFVTWLPICMDLLKNQILKYPFMRDGKGTSYVSDLNIVNV